jgi:small-conductance mechanosensitive channel
MSSSAMSELAGFVQDLLFDNELGRWVMALCTFLAVFTLLPLVKRYCQRLLQQSRYETAQLVARIITSIHRAFIWIMAVYLGSRFLEFPARVESIAWKVTLLTVWLQVGLCAQALLEHVLAREQRRRSADPLFNSSVIIIRFVATGLIWALAALLALDNLGVNITALIAGLGIGGVAIALAAQTLLKDLLGSLSIALDKPFVVGDTIIIDKLCGTVESIGLKTTRLRSTEGDEIVISNADILKSRIRNFGHMDERQAVLNIHVAYGTSNTRLLRVNEIITAAIHAQPEVRFERCHLKQIAPHALTFEAVFFALSPQGDVLHKALHHINLAVMTALHRDRIALACPTLRLLAAPGADGRHPLEAALGTPR